MSESHISIDLSKFKSQSNKIEYHAIKFRKGTPAFDIVTKLKKQNIDVRLLIERYLLNLPLEKLYGFKEVPVQTNTKSIHNS